MVRKINGFGSFEDGKSLGPLLPNMADVAKLQVTTIIESGKVSGAAVFSSPHEPRPSISRSPKAE